MSCRDPKIQEQINKVTKLYQSGKSYKAISKDFRLGENTEPWCTFLGVASLPQLFQECINHSLRRSQNNTDEQLNLSRPQLPRLRSVFKILQSEGDLAKIHGTYLKPQPIRQNTKPLSRWPRNVLMTPKTGENILCTDETKAELFGRCM
ncbi:hypothetical protein ILYODFUR_029741 [Ilyodon furcidens]|uniref:Transposase n=1 Tax=Ilyodon furcidens TaxID=33524 RepID=A0ABV0TZ56_9TELE